MLNNFFHIRLYIRVSELTVFGMAKSCSQGSKFNKIAPIDSAHRELQNEYHIMEFCEFDPWPKVQDGGENPR